MQTKRHRIQQGLEDFLDRKSLTNQTLLFFHLFTASKEARKKKDTARV
jgi:hypothetical protein